MVQAYPKIIILSGNEEGQEISLKDRDRLLVGRSDDNDLILSDTSVSRRHVSFIKKDAEWYLVDEGSRNGCFLNDNKLAADQEQILKNADVIRLGIYDLRFLAEEVSASEIRDKTSYKKEAIVDVEEAAAAAAVNEALGLDEEDVTESEVLEGATQEIDTDGKDLELMQQGSGAEDLGKTGTSLFVFIGIAALFCLIGFALFLWQDGKKVTHQDGVTFEETLEDDTEEEVESEDGQVVDTAKTTSTTSSKNQKEQTKASTVSAGSEDQAAAKDDASKETAKKEAVQVDTPKVSGDTKGSPQIGQSVAEDNATIGQEKSTSHDSTTTKAEDTSETTSDFSTLAVAAQGTDTESLKKAELSAISQGYNVFLEVLTEPLPATIYLKEKNLGKTPLRHNILVKPSEAQELFADFELRELNDIYRKKVQFKPKPDADVVEIKIDAEIGILKILKLPRKVEFYLEGYYDYDKLKANPVKISDVVYGKPIYLPYGKYIVELREATKLAGSDNYVSVIRYQREYKIDKNNRVLKLNIPDKELQFFPAVIKSTPNNAAVYYGGEKVGETPFEGNLPLGKNKLKIVKEGFFAHVADVEMTLNSVYRLAVDLKTSKIGELINEAKEQLRNAQRDEAIQTLVDALKYGGSSKEKAQVYFLLGDSFYAKKQYDQAVPYFEKARAHKSFFSRATLGLAKSYHGLGQKQVALKTVIEVLVNINKNSSPALRSEANSVFRLISPVKSVMYLYTTPPGAAVFVNEKRVNQDSPLILSDIGLGNYRLQFEKAGFETYKTKQNVKVGEFVLVKVTLKPEKR